MYKLILKNTKPGSIFIKRAGLFILFSAFSIAVSAQNPNTRVVLAESQPRIKTVIKAIEQQSLYRIARDGSFNASVTIVLDKKENTVGELMRMIARATNRPYTIVGTTITIKKGTYVESEKQVSVSVSTKSKQSLFGTVQSLDHNLFLSGATVKIEGDINRETLTDSLGYYSFENIPAGNYKILVEYSSYKKEESEHIIRANDNLRIVFLLEPIVEEDQRTFSASFVYPEYRVGPKPKAGHFENYILPYQKQRLPIMAIKTNLAYDAMLAPSLGVEFRLSKRLTLDVPFTYKPFTVDRKGFRETKVLIAQPELRFWNEAFMGHFLGAHLIFAQYNMGGIDLPLGILPKLKDSRYTGHLYGVGVSYGYHAVVSNHISFEFTLGLGYAYTDYKRYTCQDCSTFIDRGSKHYFGPTKLGISLVYMIR